MSDQAIVKAVEQPPITIKDGAPVIETSHDLKRVAALFITAGWCDRNMTKPEQVMCAIMHGQALGLNAMQAAQGIAVINGRPTAWGDTLVAVVRASGLLEYMTEKVENGVATCTVKRKGEPEPCVVTFSMEDAKKAGLAGKQGPWTQYPSRMLKLRARAFALRDTFADVLRGVAFREEVADEPGENTTRVRAAVESLTPKPLLDTEGRTVALPPPNATETIVEPVEANEDQTPFDVDGVTELMAADSGGQGTLLPPEAPSTVRRK